MFLDLKVKVMPFTSLPLKRTLSQTHNSQRRWFVGDKMEELVIGREGDTRVCWQMPNNWLSKRRGSPEHLLTSMV
jgi:hypothetical protein